MSALTFKTVNFMTLNYVIKITAYNDFCFKLLPNLMPQELLCWFKKNVWWMLTITLSKTIDSLIIRF